MPSIDKPTHLAGMVQARPQLRPAIEKRKTPINQTRINQTRLIFVDDDDLYRSIVKAELENEGFSVADFASGEAMLASLRAGSEADVVILDWIFGKTNAIDLLPALREISIDLPVVLLTGRSSPVHERLAFQHGVVDFIDKSRGTGILAVRLGLIACNKRRPVPQIFQLGHLSVKTEEGRAYWNGVDVNLTASEFKVVHLIASRAGEHVPYRQIYDAIRYAGFAAGYGEDGYRANVRSSIRRIRRKFLECDPTFDEISNYMGVGYCWGKPAGSSSASAEVSNRESAAERRP
jgi:two-component system response regulator ChvI